MTERLKQGFENLSVSMRFVLPFMMALFVYNYSGDQNRTKDSFISIKEGQREAWMKMDNIQNKATSDYEYVLQHCCANKGNVNN